MNTNAVKIKECNVWSVFMAISVAILATEVAVKAHRIDAVAYVAEPVEHRESVSPAEIAAAPSALPEEIVAGLLVESVVQIESAGNPKAVGSKGERGLMQIMRATWRETTASLFDKPLPFDRAFDPALNRQVGTAYLASLHAFLQANRGQWQADERSLLLACYNAGPQRVAAAGFSLLRLPRSTQDYVARASSLHDLFLQEHAMKLETGVGQGIMQIVQLDPTRRS